MAEITTPDYWDCECDEDYIQPKDKEGCDKCGVKREDQPDSLCKEVERRKVARCPEK